MMHMGVPDFSGHGAHANDHFDSSDGCIVMGPLVRQAWRDGGDMDLEVTE